MVDRDDLVFSIVLELIFYNENDGFDLIFSGVFISLSWNCFDFVSTEDRSPVLSGEVPKGSFADSRFALSQFM